MFFSSIREYVEESMQKLIRILLVLIFMMPYTQATQPDSDNLAFNWNECSTDIKNQILTYETTNHLLKDKIINQVSNSLLNRLSDNCFFNVAFNPHNKNELAAGSNDKVVELWNHHDRESIGQLQGHEHWVRTVAYDPHNNTKLASGSEDKTVVIWDLHNKKMIQRLQGHEDVVCSVAYDPHGSAQLLSGSGDKTMAIWDLRNGKIIGQLQGHKDRVRSIAYNPSKDYEIASGSNDKSVAVWDLRTKKKIHTLQEHTGEISSIAYDPHNNTKLASGSHDKTIKIWNLDNGTMSESLTKHDSFARSIAYDKNKPNTMISGSENGIVEIWDLRKKRVIRRLESGQGSIHSITYNPHNSDELALAGAMDQHLQIGNLSSLNEIEQWFADTYALGSQKFTFRDQQGKTYTKPINLLKMKVLLDELYSSIDKNQKLSITPEQAAYIALMPPKIQDNIKTLMQSSNSKKSI